MTDSTKNVVAGLNPSRRVVSPRAGRVVSILLATAMGGSGLVAAIATTPRVRGVALVVAIVAVVAAAARRLVGGSSLSSSGHKLDDYRHTESNWNPPSSMH